MQFSFARNSGQRHPARLSNVVTDGARDEIEIDGPCAVSLKRAARIGRGAPLQQVHICDIGEFESSRLQYRRNEIPMNLPAWHDLGQRSRQFVKRLTGAGFISISQTLQGAVLALVIQA